MGTVVTMKNTMTIEECRLYISEPWQKAVGSIVETGQRLIEVKKSKEHGEWLKIFEKNKPFSEQTARCLMAIAQHSVLSNRQHASVLPPSWYTLYILSQIPEHILLKLIQDGKVNSEINRSQAETLKGYKEKIEALLLVIIQGCVSAISVAPCNCEDLENEITPEVLTNVRNVIDTWTRVEDYLRSLGMKKE